jgi:hypothetical protein
MHRIVVLALLCVLLSACGGIDRVDYVEVAHGDQARRDRAAALTGARDALEYLREAMPWAAWRGEEAGQYCEAMEVGFFGGTPILRCMTSVTAYAAFGGELADEILRFDSTVTAEGWQASGSPAANGVIDYYEQFYGRPEGPRTYDAGNLPELQYWAGSGSPAICGARGPTLRHGWLEAGQPVTAPISPAVPDNPDLIDRYDKPLDRVAVAGELLTHNRYVAVLSASVQCDYEVT